MAQTQTNQTDPSEDDDDDDFYDAPSTDFPKAEHLAPSIPPHFGPGRLVAIWALESGTRQNAQGKSYPFVKTITVTLDDGPDGNLAGPGWSPEAAEMIGPGVQRLDDFQHSTGGLVSRLSKRVHGRNAKGVPLRQRPMIGRINTQPSKVNKNVAAFSISEPTDADLPVLEKHKAMIRAINQEVAAQDAAAEDAEAFS